MCASEVSDIEANIAPEYDDLLVWAIASREDEGTLRAWRDAFDIETPILIDRDGAVAALYQGTMAFPTGAYPQEWLVGTDGIIEYYANEYEYEALAAVIEAELR